MSLLFEAVFEQLEVELGAFARVSKHVGHAAVMATIGARQQSQKCKTRCEGEGVHHNCGLLGDHNCSWLVEWRCR
jgi:3-hydroxyacyl-CoA dehydrogenase